MTKNKPGGAKGFNLLAMAGIFGKGKKFVSKFNIGTQPLPPKRESFKISKQKQNKMKGKKARRNRGKIRGKSK